MKITVELTQEELDFCLDCLEGDELEVAANVELAWGILAKLGDDITEALTGADDETQE